MARKKVFSNDIPDELFKEAIEWLEKDGTKKGACLILSKGATAVNSNTVMERLIQEWKDSKELDERMRKKKRGTEIDKGEGALIIQDYLSGTSITDISKSNYRSMGKIKAFLEDSGALLRTTEVEDPSRPFTIFPPMFPDKCMKDEFKPGSMAKLNTKGEVLVAGTKGEIVWVAGYQCFGEIRSKVENDTYGRDIYSVYLLDHGRQQYTYQEAYNLASVEHLKELGVNVEAIGYKWVPEDIKPLIAEAIRQSRKRDKDTK